MSSESISDHEVETQPISEESLTGNEFPFKFSESKFWGILKRLMRVELLTVEELFIELNADSFSVGRSKDNNFVISRTNFPARKVEIVSSCQFVICRKQRLYYSPLESPIYIYELTDKSSNGTFVNCKKIGKGNTVVLDHADVIAIAEPNLSIFMFRESQINSLGSNLDEYKLYHCIGKGGFGEVKYAVNRKTSQEYAIKIIKNSNALNKHIHVFDEIKILKNYSHPFIVEAYEVFMKDKHTYIVMEYMAGADLNHLIINKKRLSEIETKFIFYQLVSALSYLHSHKIIHRDLKPGNILLSSDKEPYPIIKVSDFGLSKIMRNDLTKVHTLCGSRFFSPPELTFSCVTKMYNTRSDIWSVGVLLYLCLSGKLPFSADRSDLLLEEQIMSAKFFFEPELFWQTVSPDAKIIIRKSIVKDVFKRCSIDFIEEHAWFTADKQLELILREKFTSLPYNIGKDNKSSTSNKANSIKLPKLRCLKETIKTSDLTTKSNNQNKAINYLNDSERSNKNEPSVNINEKELESANVHHVNCELESDELIIEDEINQSPLKQEKRKDDECYLTPKRFCPSRN